MKRLAVFFLIASLFPAAASAQRRGGTRRGARGGAHGAIQMDEQTTIILISALLDLSDSQQQQLRAIFDAALPTAAPIVTQLDGAHDALFQAVKAGKGDDQIKGLAAQEGAVTSQLLTLQAQTFSKLWAILAKDQKTQADASIYEDIAELLSTARPPTAPAPSQPPATPPK
jgi:Spy/CpxP family protein refolding chaperone